MYRISDTSFEYASTKVEAVPCLMKNERGREPRFYQLYDITQTILLVVVMLLLLSLTAGCRGKGEGSKSSEGGNKTAKQGTAGRPLRFGFVPKLLDNPVFSISRQGAEDAAKALGNIEILWRAPVDADVAKQAEIIEGLISLHVDGIAISANEPDPLIDVINRAVDAGIPTITFDSDSPKSKRLTFYGTNNYEGGKLCGEMLAKEMGGRGTVAILTGVFGAHNLEERIQAVKDVFKDKYPDMKIITTRACNDSVDKAISEIESVMQAHPDLGGWIFVGGWPLFVPPPGPFESIGSSGKTKVISFDTLPEQLKYLEAGYVQGLVGQKYYEWGYESVKILKGIIEGKKYESFTDSGLDVVTKKDLERFKEKLKERRAL